MARVFAALLATAIAGLVVYVMLARFGYPYELEWMTGAMLDHVERMRLGLPLYGPPSGDWTPFIYTPGYYWLAAIASRFAPEIAACRGISIASTAVAAACTWRLARRAGASRYFAAMAPLLFLACFGLTCDWYDVERSDSLLVAMLAVGAVLAQSERVDLAALAGAVVGLGFFVKQPATTFAVLVPIALVVAGRVRKGIAFAVGAAVAIVPLFVVLDARSHGWMRYYCLTLPSAHGIAAKYATLFFVSDLAKAPVLALATIGGGAALVAVLRARVRREVVAIDEGWLALAAFLGAGFVASALSRMHVGGWPNVLMFWTTFACPAACVLATRLDEGATPTTRVAIAIGLALQAAAGAPDPNEQIPDAKARRLTAAVDDRLRAIEATSGEVLLLGRGHVTAKRHATINALIDVLRAGAPVPDDMMRAARDRAWAAIVVNKIDDLRLTELLGHECELFEPVARSYFVAEALDDRAPEPVVGFPTEPRLVLRPRRAPLAGATHDELVRRLTIERGLAERNMRAAQADPALRSDGLGIEEEAARAIGEARAVN